MVYVRQNVYELGGDWADPILWYARGVGALKQRWLAEPTSWRFYGGIHGFSQPLWDEYDYLAVDGDLPPDDVMAEYWDQCQHGTWYFLPWHRGYLIALEAAVREAIVDLGGPEDWALPYWNYSKPDQNALPPAFASPDWPDGTGDNPLYAPQRYGPANDGNVYVPQDEIDLDALGDPDFVGVSGGSPGFGGLETGFSHFGGGTGDLEFQPHNIVHVLVGGEDTTTGLPGLMTDPATAGLDPIFWLHHCNIDRLWEVWRQNPPEHVDPTEQAWIDGPAAGGERPFIMPMPGDQSWTFTPGDVSDLSQLDYTYDDLAPPAVAAPRPGRTRRLGAPKGTTVSASDNQPELVGASTAPLPVVGLRAEAAVTLDADMRRKVARSLTAETAAPDRLFLNLENIRGQSNAVAFKVYLDPPQGAGDSPPEDRLAGSVGLFGVRQASDPDGKHAGEGLTVVLEVTGIVDALNRTGGWDAESLEVRIVPRNPVPESAEISIGRISLFRQAG